MPKYVPELPTKSANENNQRPEQQKDRIIKDITFFGDSSIPEDSQLYEEVFTTAQILAKEGYSIVNGGGPGVMQAATNGAESVGGHTTAVYWEPKLASIFEGKNLTNVTDESNTYSSYLMRTLGLIEEGEVYVVCQGGTGTISEFGLVWALAKLYYGKHKPVILYGKFWPDLIESMQKNMLIDDNELGVLNYASTPQDVLELVKTLEMEVQVRTRKTYAGDETPFVLAPKYSQEYEKHMEKITKKHKRQIGNYLTRKQLEEFRQLVSSPARILDLGSGAGYDLSFLSDYYSVTSVEADAELIEIARFENPNADILHIDIRDYEVQQNVFKGIWARDILHHLHEKEIESVINKLAKGLVPGGVLYAIVREGEIEQMEKDMHAGKEIEKFYHYFTEEELKNYMEKAGLQTVRIDHVQKSHDWMAGIFRKPEN